MADAIAHLDKAGAVFVASGCDVAMPNKCVHLGRFAARNIVCRLDSWLKSKSINAATA